VKRSHPDAPDYTHNRTLSVANDTSPCEGQAALLQRAHTPDVTSGTPEADEAATHSIYGSEVSLGHEGRAHQTSTVAVPNSPSRQAQTQGRLLVGEPMLAPGEKVLLDQHLARGAHGAEPGDVRVSVVVATYRRSGTIAPLLRDLAAQQFPSGMPASGMTVEGLEVVIVNDGGPVAVHAEVPADLPFRVRVVERPNGGPAAARHTGIRLSSGSSIVIVDDDMRLDPTFIAGHLAALEGGADVVYGVIEGTDHDDSLFTRFHQRHIDLWLTDMRSGGVPRGDHLCTGNVAFTRSAYDRVGGFDRSLVRCEDRDLGIRLEFADATFAFAPDARSVHRSDHVDVGQWRRRSAIYGASDAVIANKHPGHAELSPWAFLSVLPSVSHPFLALIAMAPALAGPAGTLVYRAAQLLDKGAKHEHAVRLAGLTYGIEYYRGAGTQWGGVVRALRELRSWMAAGRPAPDGSPSNGNGKGDS
jgi:GT2 family glycosyltransferase